MGRKQVEQGKATEQRIAEFFHNNGYWAYIVPKTIGGQPFDIIACRGNTTWFVDAKHIEEHKASFDFNRIEPNQKTSMCYAHNFAKMTNIGFGILWDREPQKLFFLPYVDYIEMAKQGIMSVKIKELKEFVYENFNIE